MSGYRTPPGGNVGVEIPPLITVSYRRTQRPIAMAMARKAAATIGANRDQWNHGRFGGASPGGVPHSGQMFTGLPSNVAFMLST